MRMIVSRGALCALLVSLLWACASSPHRLGETAAQSSLHVVFSNRAGLDSSQIYVGFVGGPATTLNAVNTATGAALAVSRYGNAHWYTLSSLPQGITMRTFIAGRIYVGYGQPWAIQNDGYEPPPGDSGDLNYLKRYDKMEMTYTPSAADVADTTSFDYFGIPLELRVYSGGTSGSLVGAVTASPTTATVAALTATTTPPGAAVVHNTSGGFVRVIGPGKIASPAAYDNFSGYLGYLRQYGANQPGGGFANIAGHFNGVGAAPTDPLQKPQDYDFQASVDAAGNIVLTGQTTVLGQTTIEIANSDLSAQTGIYGANPAVAINGGKAGVQGNNVYSWIVGDLLAGINIGAAGSTVQVNGVPVGQMKSQDWAKLSRPNFYAGLQPNNNTHYNRWAGALFPISQAYNFAYGDRFPNAKVTVPLDPSRVDTLEITFLPDD